MNCDHNLFLALNFDGGPFMDRLMLTVSGTTMWLPLYALTSGSCGAATDGATSSSSRR